jgi:clan AA aspartic protease
MNAWRINNQNYYEVPMGATHVTVTIRNPANPQKYYEDLFLVDTGAIDSLAPRDKLEAIGLKPKAKRTYEPADGTEIVMEITTGDLEFMGEIVGGTIILAEPGTEPILGVTALESVGIDIDPQNQRLKRLQATRLKKIIPNLNKPE